MSPKPNVFKFMANDRVSAEGSTAGLLRFGREMRTGKQLAVTNGEK